MKSCGMIMRILALVTLLCIGVTTIIQYSLYAEEIKEWREELEERIDKHDEEIYDEHYDEDGKCSTCESFEETKTEIKRSSTRTTISCLQNFLLYTIFAAILYVLGEIASRSARAKKENFANIPTPAPVPMPAAAPVPAAAPAPAPVPAPAAEVICPVCGKHVKQGNRFCNACGTSLAE